MWCDEILVPYDCHCQW